MTLAPGVAFTLCALTSLLAALWYAWDAATGRRAERKRQREQP